MPPATLVISIGLGNCASRAGSTLRERGLSGSPVTVWVYDGSITVEYQTVTLSRYSIELQEDRKQIKQVLLLAHCSLFNP
ncbi:MAG TPA: hypothetical protein VIY29_23260 [Ktedonobacteraceae bacterium]